MHAAYEIDTANLRSYQVAGARFLAGRPRSLLADEMRLGKTAQALRSLPPKARTLIVAPAIVQRVWRDETLLWRPDLAPHVLDSASLRAPRSGEVIIISYDSLPDVPAGWAEALLSEDMSQATLILDEAHYVKSDDALRTQRVRALSRQCGRCIAITGTPLVGKLLDLYGVLVSAGLAGEYTSAVAYRRALKKKETADIASVLAECMLRRTRREVFPELPSINYQTVEVEAPEDLREWLDEVTDAWDRLEMGPDDLPPFELVSEALKALARARTDAAMALAEELIESGPLVVFSTHREPVLEIGEALGAALVGDSEAEERADAVAAFQAGEIDCLALTMQTGGVGIDLSRANQILEVDLDWTPGVNAQAEARCVKVDKHEPVEVYRLVTDHPLDRRVLRILELKERRIANVVG